MFEFVVFKNIHVTLFFALSNICMVVLSWSCGSWIDLYSQYLSSLKLWVRIPLMASCTRYNIMWYSLSITCSRSVFSLVSSNNKADRHNNNWNIAQSGVKHHKPIQLNQSNIENKYNNANYKCCSHHNWRWHSTHFSKINSS